MLKYILLIYLIAIQTYAEETFIFKTIKRDPEMVLIEKGDQKHLLEEFDGKYVLLHFWASWNSDSVGQLVQLDKIAKDFRKKPLVIIPISEDFKGIEVVDKFYEDSKLTHLPKYMDHKQELFHEFAIKSLPTTIILNKEGNEIARARGKVKWESSETITLLENILEGKNG